MPILDEAAAVALLAGSRRIAIVGASPDPSRPSHGVMRTLLAAGYDCVPVNPTCDTVLGVAAYPTLEAATEATRRFDIVDVFRRPEHTPEVARSAVAVGAGSLWLQLGVVNWEAARIANDAGLPVVMDRCTAIDLRVTR
ncbi:MAG: CoA-binding protein [Candidatus Limnocylindrales bacterium]